MGELFNGCCLHVCTKHTPALLAVKPCKHPEIHPLQNLVLKCNNFPKECLKKLGTRKQILRLKNLLRITWHFLIVFFFFEEKLIF